MALYKAKGELAYVQYLNRHSSQVIWNMQILYYKKKTEWTIESSHQNCRQGRAYSLPSDRTQLARLNTFRSRVAHLQLSSCRHPAIECDETTCLISILIHRKSTYAKSCLIRWVCDLYQELYFHTKRNLDLCMKINVIRHIIRKDLFIFPYIRLA